MASEDMDAARYLLRRDLNWSQIPGLTLIAGQPAFSCACKWDRVICWDGRRSVMCGWRGASSEVTEWRGEVRCGCRYIESRVLEVSAGFGSRTPAPRRTEKPFGHRFRQMCTCTVVPIGEKIGPMATGFDGEGPNYTLGRPFPSDVAVQFDKVEADVACLLELCSANREQGGCVIVSADAPSESHLYHTLAVLSSRLRWRGYEAEFPSIPFSTRLLPAPNGVSIVMDAPRLRHWGRRVEQAARWDRDNSRRTCWALGIFWASCRQSTAPRSSLTCAAAVATSSEK